MEKINWTDRVKIKKYYTELMRRGIAYIQQKDGILPKLVAT